MPSKIKRYVVFAYPAYYPGGGWTDFEGSFDTIGKAFNHADSLLAKRDNIEIIDLECGEDCFIYPQYRTPLEPPNV